jgi:hypothetical protein
MRFLLSMFSALLLIVSQSPFCLAETGESDIQKLNNEFRTFYATAKAEIRAHLSPVLVMANGKMVLIRNGEREEFAYMPEEWSVLKTVDHIGLGLFVALTNHTGEKLTDDMIARLQKYKSAILAARDEFEAFKYSSTNASGAPSSANLSAERTANRQKLMIDLSLKFIDKVTAERFVSFPALKKFCADINNMSVTNAYEAVSLELAAIDSKLKDWRKKMDKDEWDRLYVVISGSHMARQHERNMQYFLDLFGQKEEGDRVVYNEGPSDENRSLDLLVTHILDARIGEVFFHERMRMHRDMLGDEATRYLRYHKPH